MFQLSVPVSSRILCSGFLPFRVRFNCERRFFFKEPLAPFRRGLDLIAGGVLSIWNLLRKFLPARRSEVRCPGVHRGEAGLSNRPRDGDPPGSITTLHPRSTRRAGENTLNRKKIKRLCRLRVNLYFHYGVGRKSLYPALCANSAVFGE